MFEHEECRAYIDHVRLLFRHLREMVEQLKAKVDQATESAVACEDARHLLAEIGDKFGAYVAEEKGGGCIEEAVCRCPRLAPQEDEISAQYPQIQTHIQTISRLLAGGHALGTSGHIIGEETERLAAALNKLESDERYLLREAFGTDESFSSVR